MAVRELGDTSRLQVNVHLRDGTVVGPCDVPERPLGDNCSIVGVWQGDKLTIYPMDLVAKVEMFTEESCESK